MDSARHLLAVALLVVVPPALLFWFVVHPLVSFWRRLGPGRTLGIVGVLMGGLMFGLYRVRGPLLTVEFGASPALAALGAACLAAATVLFAVLKRHLTLRILIGVPELSSQGGPGKLLTEGIYARTRNPRYVQYALTILGCALVSNYLAVYVLFALSVPGFYFIVRLEERELLERFGAEYAAYCRRVPRFMPRLDARL
jgi:protein-S-isoprenylcysteine O-methyltransferase Ste14